MALTKLVAEVNNIQLLADQPTETAVVIKQKFDKAGSDIKAYLNETLTVEIDENLATKQEVLDAVAGAVPAGSVTDVYLSNAAGNIKQTVSSHLADNAAHQGVIGRVENAEYNIYQLFLQSYYDAKYPYKKGLFFDGFADSNVVDLASSSIVLDTVNKKVVSNYCPIQQLISNNNQFLGYASDNVRAGQTFVLTTSAKVTDITVNIAKVGLPTDSIQCKLYKVGVDGKPTTIIATSTTSLSGSSLSTSVTEKTFNFNATLTPGSYAFALERSTYDAGNYYTMRVQRTDVYPDGSVCYASSSSWSLLATHDLYFIINITLLVQNPIYQSVEQPFSQSFNNAFLYVKSKTVTGCSITADIAIYTDMEIFAPMTLDSTRDLGDGFQEDKFIYTATTAGNKAKVKLTLNRPDTTTEYEANQYGVILGVA